MRIPSNPITFGCAQETAGPTFSGHQQTRFGAEPGIIPPQTAPTKTMFQQFAETAIKFLQKVQEIITKLIEMFEQAGKSITQPPADQPANDVSTPAPGIGDASSASQPETQPEAPPTEASAVPQEPIPPAEAGNNPGTQGQS